MRSHPISPSDCTTPQGTDFQSVSRVEPQPSQKLNFSQVSPVAPPPPKPSTGFTFIEVLAALAIFAIGFLAIAGLQTRAVNSSTHARTISLAMELAEARAEFYHALPLYPNFPDDSLPSLQRFETPGPLAAGTHEHVSGRYTVQSIIADNTPLAPVANIYTHPSVPAQVLVSKTIFIAVHETAHPGRILAEKEMIKVWEQDL